MKAVRIKKYVMAPVLRVAVVVLLLAGIGCLGEPEIDERWTLLEMQSVSPQPGQAQAAGSPINVSVSSRITYRQILTGFLVAEVRYSDSVSPAEVTLDHGAHTAEVAQSIDRILANSVTAGRATKAVTGFDHLMRDVRLSFTAQIPPEMFDAVGGDGLYLVLYMGSGDEVRLQDGRDSLVVTPFVSGQHEVLFTGFALDITQPGGGS